MSTPAESDIPADIAPARVQERLKTLRYGRKLEVKAHTASTNDDARAALVAGAEDGFVVLADHQTQGRGARGRVWESPAGSDLYLSIVARPKLPMEQLPFVTLATGLGVARCLQTYVDADAARIKWPNDVLLDGAKAAGILVESASVGTEAIAGLVIGIGLNVGRRAFPELDFPATSLALRMAEAPARADVLARLLLEVETSLDALVAQGPEPTVREVDARLAMRGERVRVEAHVGEVLGVRGDGQLRLRTPQGELHVSAGRLRPEP